MSPRLEERSKRSVQEADHSETIPSQELPLEHRANTRESRKFCEGSGMYVHIVLYTHTHTHIHIHMNTHTLTSIQTQIKTENNYLFTK